MTITRAKKTSARALQAPLSAEQFIAGAETGAPSPGSARVAGRQERAMALVKGHMPWAAGAGLLPLPLLDLFIISGVQYRMLAKMSEEYGVPFREEFARTTIATMIASIVQYAFSGNLAVAAIRFVPIAGPLLGAAVLPAFAAATTYAIGKVFITHFESGGTFLDFDPRKVEAHFRAEFDRARAGGASVA